MECLGALWGQQVHQWADVIVVDDGSDDGTGEAVQTGFPEAIVLVGDGSLWWGGGINLGMKHAFDAGASHVIWLNDDCLPQPGSLATLVEASQARQAISIAPCLLEETGEVHYAGQRKTVNGLEMVSCDKGKTLECDTGCGNCVCVPQAVVELIGGIDTRHFPHAMGDADYGLRASEAGIRVIVVGSAACTSSYGTNTNRESWLLGRVSIAELWSNCRHPTNGWLTRSGLYFHWRHWGWRGLGTFTKSLARLVATSLVRLLVPQPVLRRLLHKKSSHYQLTETVRCWEETKDSDPPS